VKQLFFEKTDKKEFRMKHCFLAKKNTVEAKAWLDKHYLDSAPAKSTVENWFTKFERGEMSIECTQWTPERGCFRRKLKKCPQSIKNG
jgi:hypothetical protein